MRVPFGVPIYSLTNQLRVHEKYNGIELMRDSQIASVCIKTDQRTASTVRFQFDSVRNKPNQVKLPQSKLHNPRDYSTRFIPFY